MQINTIDQNLLNKSKRLLIKISIYHDENFIKELAYLLCEMWETAKDTTERHQSILAVLESAVLTIIGYDGHIFDDPTYLGVFSKALDKLSQNDLKDEDVQYIRSAFIQEGFGTMPWLSNK